VRECRIGREASQISRCTIRKASLGPEWDGYSPCELEKREMTIRNVLSSTSSEMAPGRVRISSSSTQKGHTSYENAQYSVSFCDACLDRQVKRMRGRPGLTIPKLVHVRHGDLYRVETHPELHCTPKIGYTSKMAVRS
jgi:hypothetical protein